MIMASEQRAASPPFLSGVGDIAANYDCFILDVWGVLHNGLELYPGTIDCLTRLREGGKKILLLSNTPDRGITISAQLAAMGLPRELYDHILTAGDSSYEDLKTRQGQSCWYAGRDGYRRLTEGLDLDVLNHPDGADFIVNALYDMDEDEQRAAYALLDLARAKDLPMICINPDLVVHVGDHLKICPGTYALHYEEIGGTVIYHGKPHLPIYQGAWALLGKPDKDRIVAVGDSLHTDIRGASGFGIDSVFNVTGIHREELAGGRAWEDLFQALDFKPDFGLDGFKY